MSEKKLLECIPNFSEGRDTKKIEKIVNPFRTTDGVKLLDYSADKDHNRLVITALGGPEELKEAVFKASQIAVDIIDLNKHEGEHPRMGAVDVVPFTPVKNVEMEEAIELSKEVGKKLSEKLDLPIYLYEESASNSQRKNLANIRKGEFEDFSEKIKKEEWKPDYGKAEIHPTAGATVVGARMPLVAFNINLDTDNLDIANKIARQIRHINGGFRYCKSIGIELEDRNIVQVSMNLTDYTKTAVYRVFETVKMECKRYGVNVLGSEIIGLVPMAALVDTAEYYLGLEDFKIDQVLETRL